jgi:hypothetical protein
VQKISVRNLWKFCENFLEMLWCELKMWNKKMWKKSVEIFCVENSLRCCSAFNMILQLTK